ncbi:MAG: EAL domain-containing protein [Halofilum sp. (in: g-proteobacteria)]
MPTRVFRASSSLAGEFRFCAVTAGLLLIGTAVVYTTGGTSYAYPYVQLIPVVVAAARYNATGGIVVAVIGALLLGPLMPLDVARGIGQTTANWVTRIVFFVGLGAFTGWLFARVRAQLRERDQMAREDHATGLANSAALEEALQTALASGSLNGADQPVLYLVRITDFFDALDAIGFDAGDPLAGAIARRIETAYPELGRAYRFSAAEIAFVAEGVAPERADTVAAEVNAVGDRSVDVRGIPVRVELCIGFAVTQPEDRDHPYGPIRRAHLALFAAQERHQAYACYDSGLERANKEVFDLITRVREGLEQGQFELFYQPKIRLVDDAVVGVEALIRWRDPTQGIVAPGRFMPKVERTSLIDPLTRFAFNEACRFADKHPGLGVSVNVSPRSLYDERLLDDLCATIERLDVPASSIEIEITEGVVAYDPERAAERLQRLRSYGMPLSIDDFGTGYSSFAYLHRLPVTGLKIDRSFLVAEEEDPRVLDVLACITQAGHSLGLEVIAEGVETEAQLDSVRKIGCDQAQGFYFARPQPATELEQWLERRTSDAHASV